MKTQIYPTDLSDSRWQIIQNLVPAAKSGGHPRSLDMRRVINAILYVVVGGIQWRMLWLIWVNGGYRGPLLRDWVAQHCRFCLQVVLCSDDQKGFAVLPRRWVVERTFAWLNHH